MIKQTYEKKKKTKASTKQVLLAANQEIETQVETILNAGKRSHSAKASSPCERNEPPAYQVIKLGIDVHLDRYVVVRQIEGGAPQPPQRFSPAQFLDWGNKQTALGRTLSGHQRLAPLGSEHFLRDI